MGHMESRRELENGGELTSAVSCATGRVKEAGNPHLEVTARSALEPLHIETS